MQLSSHSLQGCIFQILGTDQQADCDNGPSCMHCLLSAQYVPCMGPVLQTQRWTRYTHSPSSQSSKTDNQVSYHNKVDTCFGRREHQASLGIRKLSLRKWPLNWHPKSESAVQEEKRMWGEWEKRKGVDETEGKHTQRPSRQRQGGQPRMATASHLS